MSQTLADNEQGLTSRVSAACPNLSKTDAVRKLEGEAICYEKTGNPNFLFVDIFLL